MKIGESFSYSVLKKKEVIDSEGKTVGKNLLDVIFSPNLKEMTHWVVGGGFLEELMEDIKLKKDIDPVFSADSIEEIYKEIKLSVKKSELKPVIEGGIPRGHYRFTDLSKMDVVDKNGARIGNVIDAAFFDEDNLSFVIGGSTMEEFLEKIRVIPDVDLIVPSQNITSVKDNKISLNLAREMLATTLQAGIKKGSDLEKAKLQDYRKKVTLISHQRLA
ncbi:MAG: PRC-barrel domain-containing protein [Candidatus Odinarchaeota archaeon]